MRKIVLASSSPRRQELLKLLVAQYEVMPSAIDETTIQAETPKLLARALAIAKALDVSNIWSAEEKENFAVAQDEAAQTNKALIIGCDTVVEAEGKTLGKPRDPAHAKEMLEMLSGKTHFVHTGVCIQDGLQSKTFVETSAVTFAQLSEKEIMEYTGTEEPYDKAGGYAIQGGAAKFVTRIDGCYFNIMGLPVAHLYKALKAQGYL